MIDVDEVLARVKVVFVHWWLANVMDVEVFEVEKLEVLEAIPVRWRAHRCSSRLRLEFAAHLALSEMLLILEEEPWRKPYFQVL